MARAQSLQIVNMAIPAKSFQMVIYPVAQQRGYMREEGIDLRSRMNVRVGFFGAEPWTEGMRQEIEERFGIEAFDIYGLTEVIGPGVAAECVQHQGLHINEDHFYPEVIDPDTGKRLPDGQVGELIFTCLTREALPLLRYRTRDRVALQHDPCPCGRTSVRMLRVRGRTDDMLIVRGMNLFPTQIEQVLLSHAGLTPRRAAGVGSVMCQSGQRVARHS